MKKNCKIIKKEKIAFSSIVSNQAITIVNPNVNKIATVNFTLFVSIFFLYCEVSLTNLAIYE